MYNHAHTSLVNGLAYLPAFPMPYVQHIIDACFNIFIMVAPHWKVIKKKMEFL